MPVPAHAAEEMAIVPETARLDPKDALAATARLAGVTAGIVDHGWCDHRPVATAVAAGFSTRESVSSGATTGSLRELEQSQSSGTAAVLSQAATMKPLPVAAEHASQTCDHTATSGPVIA